MKTQVKIAIGVTAFVSVIALIVTLVFYFTSSMAKSADAFFTAVKQKDMVTAGSYLAEDFKARTDGRTLTAFLANNAILNFKESSWSNREINNIRGELDGTITTETGGVIPIKLSFVKENGQWKIYALQKPPAGLQSDTVIASSVPEPVAAPIPAPTPVLTKVEQTTLAKQSMHNFIVSIAKKDMTYFRTTISRVWQDQFSIEKLNKAFKSVMDTNTNWSGLDTVDPIFPNEANLDNNGVLSLTGFYATKPSVQFDQKYIYEGAAWKLVSFSFQSK